MNERRHSGWGLGDKQNGGAINSKKVGTERLYKGNDRVQFPSFTKRCQGKPRWVTRWREKVAWYGFSEHKV